MSIPQSVNRAATAQIDLKLPLRNANTATRPVTIQRSVAKTGAPLPESMKEPHRSGAVSRAGHHRWPQATMVVMGGTERQVFDTELLTVTTRAKETTRDLNATDAGTKQREEETDETKPRFPDIVGRSNQPVKPEANPRSRLATGSPTKQATALPKFGKGITKNEEKSEEVRKVVRNIKFWRGTTPVTRDLPRDKRDDKDEDEHDPDATFITQSLEDLKEQESWNDNLTTPLETHKHQYYSWHMALRDRLLKHERMRYHEAVTRISKYRQRLRQRPTIPVNPNTHEVEVWKNMLQRNEENKKRATTSNLPPGIRMSPTKEWKPHVIGEEPTPKKPPFFGKPAALANDVAKKQFNKQGNNLNSSLSPHHKTNTQSENESPNPNYPVHGEGLLKTEIRALSALRNSAKSAFQQTSIQETPTEEDTKAQTRALLIDLKQQLKSPPDPANSKDTDKVKRGNKSAKRGQTAPHQARTDLGAKLKLLLQNSAQSPRGESQSGGRDGQSRQKSTRSRMRSRQSGYRPLTRPRTYGDGSLPKIHNIIASSLWKRQGNNDESDKDTSPVKHRLTLNGIASREPFTSGVIAIAKKHISNRNGKETQEDTETTKIGSLVTPINKDNNDFPGAAKHTPMISQLRIVSKGHEDEANKPESQSYSSLKKRNAAQRLYTPATVMQPKVNATSASLSKAFHKSLRENPQHMSLKLITSLSGEQQALQELEDDTHGTTTALTSSHQPLRGKKRAVGKNKVLRIAVVEPPLTARERQRRQQEMSKSRQRLTFNATHAAVSNFTSAMLNSELALRAPSSSPVDMFFRSLYQNHLSEPMTAELWNMQKADGSIQMPLNEIKRGPPKSLEQLDAEDGNDQIPLQINHTDGLGPPVQTDEENLMQLTSLYNKISKTPTAPKVKDLMDLQRLYRVMKKHGDAYTNGGAGYYFSQSPANQIETPSKNALNRRHTNQRNLHKQPYYYYPYQGNGSGPNYPNTDHNDAPLYVVTGAQSLAVQRVNQGHQTRPRHLDTAQEGQVRHRLLRFQEPGDTAKQWKPTPKPRRAKHEITVMMPKTPGIGVAPPVSMSQLEQIQEHVLH